MSTAGSQAGLETFDALNIDYEKAYHDNAFKVACVKTAISMLPPGSRVLDVGCGTGMPVSELLSTAGLEVFGFDISPKMVHYAQSRVKGTFVVSDMLQYQPPAGPQQFAGVFIIFAHLQLSYADFHAAAYKFAQMLQPGGILVLGQMPADKYVRAESDWDATRTYVEDYDAPFMGEMLPTLALSADGQLEFLRSMGLEIVSNKIDTFQPNNPKCLPEEQQYIIARRPDDRPLSPPKPLPKTTG
ncbi:hypothetical protein CLCR_05136 [Cladophialophora carrionii]|uniref:Methyltransferase domain-containing protein n=1 Tax=Cladophialophora carrionii TaxID=86049 RepID=A0A1C1CJJ6_9EURO|nr:hypothetical protein CLCR_05136 [Cladophialophora carrionii]